jgi:hypothetical protein
LIFSDVVVVPEPLTKVVVAVVGVVEVVGVVADVAVETV